MPEPTPEIVGLVAQKCVFFSCAGIASHGYPQQYDVNQEYLREQGYVYDIRVDGWFSPTEAKISAAGKRNGDA